MQAVVSTTVENQLSAIPREVYRRRLRVEETMRKSTARCLFGTPDPVESENFVKQVFEANKSQFEQKWNWNVTLDQPLVIPTENSSNNETSRTYIWNEVMEADEMAKANLDRFDVPIAPNTRPVILLHAPTELSIIIEETSPLKKDTGTDIVGTTASGSNQVKHESSESPSGANTSSSSIASISHNDLSPPPLKQRCITDYMKVKKSQPGRKVR